MALSDTGDRDSPGSEAAPTPAPASLPALPGAPPARPVDERDLMASLRPPFLVGLVIIVVFFGVLGVWAGTAPLAGGAYAQGIVSPDGSRKTVQHLEGGIISELRVREGDVVVAGDVLVVLEGTQARSQSQLLRKQRRELLANLARLRSEQAFASEIDFPAELLAAAETDEEVAGLLDGQRTLFKTQLDAVAAQKEVLEKRNDQLEAQIAGLKQQIESQTRQLALIQKEQKGVEELVAKGLERQPRLLALKRSGEEITEGRARNEADIARTEQAMGETRLRILSVDSDFLDGVAKELESSRADLAELEERLTAAEDILRRTAITAPVSGTIVEMRFKTAGGVIRPGDPILDIVPKEDDLLIDAFVSPNDIDVVRAGLPAKVMLTAYSQRNLPTVHGKVRSVSADRLTDERSGAPYYKARVEIPKEELAKIRREADVELTAGMPAEIVIVTTERTTLDYLLSPFFRSLRRAFRET